MAHELPFEVREVDVVIVVLSAEEGLREMDAVIGGLVQEAGTGVVIAANKWDLAEERKITQKAFREEIERHLKFLPWAPVIFISAQTGRGLTSQDAETTLNTVRADGGAVRNAFLMQFVADLNQLTVHAAQTSELSALGAVFSDCLGMKIYPSLEDLARVPSGYVEYRSVMERNRAQDLFSGWRSAVQQVLYRPGKG